MMMLVVFFKICSDWKFLLKPSHFNETVPTYQILHNLLGYDKSFTQLFPSMDTIFLNSVKSVTTFKSITAFRAPKIVLKGCDPLLRSKGGLINQKSLKSFYFWMTKFDSSDIRKLNFIDWPDVKKLCFK